VATASCLLDCGVADTGARPFVLPRAERGGRDDVAAEVRVVDRADGRAGEHVADVHARLAAVCRHDLDPPGRNRVLGRDLRAAPGRRRLRGLGRHELLAEAVGRADHAGVVHFDPHALA
jgi:hypothetical protein